jgi:hypothetical protein
VAALDPFGSAIALLRSVIKAPIDHSTKNDHCGSVVPQRGHQICSPSKGYDAQR